jgi:hypothetical protein
MDANPYMPPATASASMLPERRQHWFADAVFAAFASFGLSYLALLTVLSTAWHGRFAAFPYYDTAHITFATLAAITAATVFAAVSTQKIIRVRWVPPLTYVVLTFVLAIVFYGVGFPGTGRGAIDLSPFLCGCLVGISPLIVGLSLVRFSARRLALSTIPYLCLLLSMAYAAVQT